MCALVCPSGSLYNASGQYADGFRVQELCESRGGRPGLFVLMSLTVVSVDVKYHVHLTFLPGREMRLQFRRVSAVRIISCTRADFSFVVTVKK